MMTLKEYLASDRMDYFSPFSKGYLLDYLLRTEQYWIRKYVRMLRKEEYYTNYKKNKLLRYYFFRKKTFWVSVSVFSLMRVALVWD